MTIFRHDCIASEDKAHHSIANNTEFGNVDALKIASPSSITPGEFDSLDKWKLDPDKYENLLKDALVLAKSDFEHVKKVYYGLDELDPSYKLMQDRYLNSIRRLSFVQMMLQQFYLFV